MNVALFGGTFDPVHTGHLAAAHAALNSFGLDQVLFVPAASPPHKRKRPLTTFAHRYAMVVLACAGVPQFIPSLLEAEPSGAGLNYSIVTVRKMAAKLTPEDHLYFLIGADAFLEIANWHKPVELLDSCDFVVVSRPGFPIEKIAEVIPEELRQEATSEAAACSSASAGVLSSIALRHTRLYLLTTVEADISSSAIRRLASRNKSLTGLVPDAVSEYIRKLHLFTDEK